MHKQTQKQRYFIELSYKGTDYHGWQVQPNAISVQEVINKCLSTVLREDINVTGAGRTDTGVHAKHFAIHFDTLSTHLNDLFIGKMNNFLPKDIAFHSIHKVKEDANARFDALSRTYKYFINLTKNPFTIENAYFLKNKLDVSKMNEAANVLFDYTDFTSFSKLHTQVKTNNCKLIGAQWNMEDDLLVFTIKADRFLRNMVRAIVGTLLEVGKGKLNISAFREIIESKQRGNAGVSVPAHALFLWDVEYPENIFIA